MSTLLNLLTRSTNHPHQLLAFNTWFFINAHIFYFKLLNHLTFFTYINESLKLNHIRVYNKHFSLLNFFSYAVKVGAVLSSLLLF